MTLTKDARAKFLRTAAPAAEAEISACRAKCMPLLGEMKKRLRAEVKAIVGKDKPKKQAAPRRWNRKPAVPQKPKPTPINTDDIARYIAERGVTRCPPAYCAPSPQGARP